MPSALGPRDCKHARATGDPLFASGSRGNLLNDGNADALSINPLAVSAGVRQVITDFIGNDLRTAYNLGDVNDFNFNWDDSVNALTDRNDVYRFRLDNAGTVSLNLTGMIGDANLYVLDSAGTTIAFSTLTGAVNESISRVFNAGVYYAWIQSAPGASTRYTFDLTAAGPARTPIGSLSTARDLGDMSRKQRTLRNGFLSSGDPKDYFRFDLSERGNFRVDITGLSSNLDMSLLDRNGNTITSSLLSGTSSESISRFLEAGTYYVFVYTQGGSSAFALNARTDVPSYSGDTRTLIGSLGADTFDLTSNFARTVISGNGNVDFGSGLRDVLDLSALLFSSVTINYANPTTGGVLYNPGNGTRVFDSITLTDGRQILFEGIESIRFADRIVSLSVIPDDPGFNQQSNLHMIGVHTAWGFTTGSSNVLIGIEDTGLGVANGFLHPDLSDDRTLIYNSNYRDDFQSRRGSETISHGTLVQGVIAAISNNGVGMSGINWNSDVVHIDVLGDNVGDQTIAEATRNLIKYAADNGKRLVINLSLREGSAFSEPIVNPELEALVAANPNVLFVIASGNDGDLGSAGLDYPASLARTYSNVVAVGAAWGRTDADGNPRIPGTRIQYPGFWGSQYGDGLTLMAPSEVLATSAFRFSTTGAVAFDYDTQFNGTSAATPHVTGIASLIWSVNNTLSAAEVKQIMSQTAVDLGAVGYDIFTGNGMVNADAAVRRAIAIARGATA
jgi:serine protease